MIGFIVRLFLSLFLDKDGRQALARRAHINQLEDELKIEMAKTNALINALNKQGDQALGISDDRQAEIAKALESQTRAQAALNELDPETRRRMIERVLADEPQVNGPTSDAGPGGTVVGGGDDEAIGEGGALGEGERG